MFFRNDDLTEILARSEDLLEQLAGKKILMSGSQGFLGRYFTRLFELYNETAKAKIKFIGLDNFVTSDAFRKQDKTDGDFVFLNRDLTTNEALDGISTDIDYIIHAAGIASPYYYRAKPLRP